MGMRPAFRRLAHQQSDRLLVSRESLYGYFAIAFGGGGERVWLRNGYAIPEKSRDFVVGVIREVLDPQNQTYWECLEMVLSVKVPEGLDPATLAVINRQIEKAKGLYEDHWLTARKRADAEAHRVAQEKGRENMALLKATPVGTYQAQCGPNGWALFPVSGEGRPLRFESKELGFELYTEATAVVRSRCPEIREY